MSTMNISNYVQFPFHCVWENLLSINLSYFCVVHWNLLICLTDIFIASTMALAGYICEDKFLIMFGELHIEMAALRSLGTILQDSGWTGVIVEAGVASSGTAESYLSALSVTRTRQIHQVTACCLKMLQREAYDYYTREQTEQDHIALSFEDWCEKRRTESPHFEFWELVPLMELVTFSLIRSFREGDIGLYCQSLTGIISFSFANTNVNYARCTWEQWRFYIELLSRRNPLSHKSH